MPVPRLSGLLLEKLVTERSGIKGDRDLLVALGLLVLASDTDMKEVSAQYMSLPAEDRHAVRSNLTVLSLMAPQAGMPDPRNHRSRVLQLIRRLEDVSQRDT